MGLPILPHLQRQVLSRIDHYSETASSLYMRQPRQSIRLGYKITSNFPEEERYGLTSQMRRSAVSIPSNIAEGAARFGEKEFLKFLYISRGSLSELETQYILGMELGYIDKDNNLQEYIEKLFALLGGLIKSVRGA